MIQLQKLPNKIVNFDEQFDPDFLTNLGLFCISFGRLEDMLRIVIKREEKLPDFQTIFSQTPSLTLGALIIEIEKRVQSVKVIALMAEAKSLNKIRQDFIHSTV